VLEDFAGCLSLPRFESYSLSQPILSAVPSGSGTLLWRPMTTAYPFAVITIRSFTGRVADADGVPHTVWTSLRNVGARRKRNKPKSTAPI